MKIKDILTNKKTGYMLENISYEGYPESEANSVNLEITDTIEFIKLEGEALEFRVSRLVETMPNSLFKINVSYIVERGVKLGTVLDDEKFDSLNLKIRDKLIGSAYGLISALITQITITSGNLPLITPPHCIRPKKSDKQE